ncbi:hypothetical protein [Vibrio phage BX-1]|nr:hypothetical protein [Vibrio phage BX-1]
MEIIDNMLRYNGDKKEVLPYIMELVRQSSAMKDGVIFNDVFGGSGVVSINMAKMFELEDVNALVNYNEYDKCCYRVIESLKYMSPDVVMADLEKLQAQFGPTKGNKDAFWAMRDFVNANHDRCPWLDIGIVRCAFSSTPRWNGSGGFNNPPGNRDWNPSDHWQTLYDTHCWLTSVYMSSHEFMTFFDMHRTGPDVIDYLDPPYTITNANYMHGWSFEHDLKLIDMAENRASSGGLFIMSNVLAHRGKRNHILEDWIKNNPDLNVYYIDKKTYKIARLLDTDHGTVEVLITNIKGDLENVGRD